MDWRPFEIRENLATVFPCDVAATMHVSGKPLVLRKAKSNAAFPLKCRD
jgi:hypothetical protein